MSRSQIVMFWFLSTNDSKYFGIAFNDKMRVFFKKVIGFGVERKTTKSEEKKIQMLNFACVFWVIFALFLIVKFSLFAESPFPIILYHIHVVIVLILIIWLQLYNKYRLARVSFIVLQLINVFLISNFFKPGVLAEYFCILIPLFTIYLIDNKFIQYGALLVSMLFFFVPEMFYQHYPKYMFGSGATLGLFLAPFIMIKYLMHLNSKKERSLEIQKNVAVKDKNIIDQQRIELEELNRFQSHFFINISHEIRTPLTLILGKTDELKEHEVSKYNPALAKTIDQIDIQSNKIRQIVDDVIDLAKMNTNQFRFNTKKIRISDFLNKLYVSFEPLFKQRHILFDYFGDIDAEITTDTLYLERALNNIISNALKYISKGGRFSMKLKKKGNNHIVISLQDSGIGIPEQEIDRIFDRFYQVDNDINKSQGSGIGLAFTKEVIELLGGEISVTSKIGEGACFQIALPVYNFIDSPIITSKTITTSPVVETKDDTVKISSIRKKILIVDDHKDMREYLVSLLKDYYCFEASNGDEALVFLKNNEVDMLITDYMMPVMNGYSLIKKVKELGLLFPVIMLTARADQEGKLDTLRLGLDDYITKPFDKEELKIKVTNRLQNFQSKQDFMLTEDILEKELEHESFIKKLQKFVYTNSHDMSFGVEDICKEFSISKSSLYRKIKTLTGLSSMDFINEVKLQKARAIIRNNNSITLKELSYAVGFKQSNYFSKLYQKRFGVKPILDQN